MSSSYTIDANKINNLAESLSNLSLDKSLIKSSFIALLFVLITHPNIMSKSGVIVGDVKEVKEGEASTSVSTGFIHSTIFFVVNCIFLKLLSSSKCFNFENTTNIDIIKYSFVNTLLFFALSNSDTYKLTRNLLGGELVSPEGVPQGHAVIAHGIVFLVILILISFVPNE